MRNFRYLAILFLLLSAYSCKDEANIEWEKRPEQPLPSAVEEARSFFEDYVEVVELSDRMQGLYPGNFAPDWKKAVVTADASCICVNVPFVSEVAYEGSFTSGYDPVDGPSKESYYTAVGQKMIVVKDPSTGAFGCYLVTIIPDAEHAVKSSDMAARMFDSGDRYSTFSGTALFTILGSNNYPVAAGRYKNGERYAAASWWWTNDNTEQLEEEITTLIGIKQIKARKRAMNKSEIYDCGFLSEVVVYGSYSPPSSSSSFTPFSYTSPYTSPYAYTEPNLYTGSSGTSGTAPSGYGSKSSNNTSTTINTNTSITTSSNPSKTTKKIVFDKTKYPGYQNAKHPDGKCDCKCVTDKVMRILLGNNAIIESSRITFFEEKNGLLIKTGDANAIFKTLNEHIDANKPIIGGVNHTIGLKRNDGTIDHFIVIIGRGYDSVKGQYYFNYIETAKGASNATGATNDNLRLYYDSNDGTFTSKETHTHNKKKYTLTQIRPNK